MQRTNVVYLEDRRYPKRRDPSGQFWHQDLIPADWVRVELVCESEPELTSRRETTAEIERQVRDLTRDVREHRMRLDQLTSRVNELEVTRSEEFRHDRYLEWCEYHREELLRYPDSYVAVDLEKGVVATGRTADEFERALGALDANYRDQLLVVHTSIYNSERG